MGVFRNSLLCALLALFLAEVSAKESCTKAEMTTEHIRKLSTAINGMALKLHQKLAAESSENVFFSPLSIATAFGMLFYGTGGDTAKELRVALGYDAVDLPDELVHESFKRLLNDMLRGHRLKPYTLNVANAILLDKRMDLVSSYKNNVEDLYKASVRNVDFLNEASEVVEEVNEWVQEITHGNIDKLLDELTPSAVMVLLNAVYFKGSWMSPFKPENTEKQTFYNYGKDSNTKDVSMMHMTTEMYYARGEDYQLLELPYRGDNVSMFIILPNARDGLTKLEHSLTSGHMKEVFGSTYETKVIIALPKFKLQFSKELSHEMKSLGARQIFEAAAADFSGLTPSKNVSVSEVLHKAVIEVNEAGSEAAGITGILSNRMDLIIERTPEFTADHPFLFLIRDRPSGVVLFMGRVTNL